MKCPNKNHPSYKLLVNQLGSEEAAIYTWHAYGDNFPATLKSLTDLKKELGIRNNISGKSVNLMKRRIVEYNNKYGTTHSYETRQRGESDSYDIIFIPSYLNRWHLQNFKQELTKNNIANNIRENREGITSTVSDSFFRRNSNEYFVDGEVYPTEDDARANMLFQNDNSNILGAFDSLTNTIFGLTNPNVTTFPHELGHGFMNFLINNGKEQDIKDIETVINWYNEGKNTTYPTDWNSLTSEEKTNIHEAFADGFVVYLNEGGNTTDEAMNNIFAQFAKWVKELIDTIKATLGIELNNHMRDVYDRILGLERVTESQVEVFEEIVPGYMVTIQYSEEEEGYPLINKESNEQVGVLYNIDNVWYDVDDISRTAYRTKEAAAKSITEQLEEPIVQQTTLEVDQPFEKKYLTDVDIEISEEENEDGDYNVYIKGTNEVIETILRNYDGTFFRNSENQEYDDIDFLKEVIAEDYNYNNGLAQSTEDSLNNPKYSIITSFDKNGNSIKIPVKYLDTIIVEGQERYKFQDVYGNIYYNDTLGETAAEETYLDFPEIEKPTPKFDKGTVVTYIDPETQVQNTDTVADINIVRDYNGNFAVNYYFTNSKPIHESFISSVQGVIPSENVIANSNIQYKYKRAINNLSAKFQSLFNYDFQIVEAEENFNALARFHKGVVEINTQRIIEQGDDFDIAGLISHELMHPFVRALKISNRSLYNNLIQELKENGIYDGELDGINYNIGEEGDKSVYFNSTQEDIEEEILTRYLGESISQIFNENGTINEKNLFTIASRIQNLLGQFLRWLRSIIDILTNNKSFNNFNTFVSKLNDRGTSNIKDLFGGENGLYSQYPELKDIIANAGNKNLATRYNLFSQRFINNLKIKDSQLTFREYLKEELKDFGNLYQQIESAVIGENFYTVEIKSTTNQYVDINKTENGIISISLNESLGDYGKSYAYVIKEALKEEIGNIITQPEYDTIVNDIDSAYYLNKSNNELIQESNKTLTVSELNPLMKLKDLTDMMTIKLAREEMMEEAFRISRREERGNEVLQEDLTKRDNINNLYKDINFNLSFTNDELSSFNTLTAYMAISPKAEKTSRDIILKKAAQLSEVGKNYNSDELMREANRIKFLNNRMSENEDNIFIRDYAEEAVQSIGIAYRKYMDILNTLRDKESEVSREELKRFNKELIVVRQLVSFHDQFDKIVQMGYGKDTREEIKYLKASSYIAAIKEGMEDTATALTVEWLKPYADNHNKYMKSQGYTTDEYLITPELIRNHFRYGFGEDVGYISYWLGSNVTSRNMVNALVANTVNQDLMITNISVHDASMDINIAFRDFLRKQGLSNITSSAAADYYKKNFLRKAKVLTRIYDDVLLGEYTEEYQDKWALHTQYLEDKFAIDLRNFENSLPTPKTQEEADANQDKVIAWKKSKGYEFNAALGEITHLNKEYLNPEYENIKEDPLFKVFEQYYKDANKMYGANKLRFGIIPQKFNESALSRINKLIKDVKASDKVKDQFEKIREKVNEEYQYRTEESVSYNLDGTVFKRLNTTLTTHKNEDNISLSLHETITDFVGEAYRYKALSNTQYNVENLMMLLEGNNNFDVNSRHLSQPDISFNIDTKKRYDMAIKEVVMLDKAKADGQSINEDRYSKLKAFVDKGYKEQPIRDKVLGRIVPSKEDKANKMLIAQLNHIYFGEGVDDWNIKFLNNASAKQVADAIGKWESIIRMGGNIPAAVNNVTMGNLHMFIEAHGGKYYDRKSLLKASANYLSNIHNYFMDTKNPIKTKDAQLAIIWDAIQGEIQDEFGKRVTGSLASKFFRTGSFFFATAAGEHQIQLTNMKAMALYRKVKTKNGETISLYDAYTKDENGRYKLRKDLVDFNQQDLLKFMRDLQGVNRMLNGNYSEFNKTMLQRKWYGNLLMKFRKWMYTSIRARWANERIDYERNTVEVGYFKYLLDYLKGGIINIVKKEGGFTKIKDMKDHERYAMRKALMEIGFYLGLTLLAIGLFGGGDEPKDLDGIQKFALLMMVRLHSDLELYHAGLPSIVLAPIPGVPFNVPDPTKEPLRILRSPSSSINTVMTVSKIIQGLENPSDVYEQSGPGYRKGENKLLIQGRKLIPFRNFIELYEGRFIGTIDNQLGYFEMVNKGVEGVTARKSVM